MLHEKRTHVGMMVVSTLLGAVGQIFFKIGITGSLTVFVAYIALGVISYLTSSVLYFYVLSRSHLSWAYGFGGLSYIFASLLAVIFLGEAVPPLRWLGILIIVVGTALIGLS